MRSETERDASPDVVAESKAAPVVPVVLGTLDFHESGVDQDQGKLVQLLLQAPAFMALMRGPNHIFEFVNAAYHQLVGHRDIAGRTVYDAFPEVREQGFIELLDQVFETGVPYIGDATVISLQRSPGAPLEERYVSFVYQPTWDQLGAVSGVFAHGVDITNLVLARQRSDDLATQIEQESRSYRAMLSSIKDFVYCFDLAGRFIYANDALLDLLGLVPGQIEGKTFHDLPYPKKLADDLQAQIADVIATGKTVRDETAYTSPFGQQGFYEYIFVPIFGPDGKVEQVSGSTREVTRYKEMEQQKDDFIAIASHELKTPVTSIKAYAQILQRRFTKEQNANAAELLSKMDTQLDKLTGLIDDLLDSTKIVSGNLQLQRELFDFDVLTAEIVEELQRTTTRHQLVTLFAAPVQVIADRDRVGQVMTNLISNAIKYSPGSDSIEIFTSVSVDDAIFRVHDFGPGLSPESRAHVFERFYRGIEPHAESIPGLGLGLFISAEIIRHLDGRIWVENNQAPGAAFGFALPLVTPV